MSWAGQDLSLTTSLGMPSLSISLNISRAVLGFLACTLTAMREFMQYVFGLRPASFIIRMACRDQQMPGRGDNGQGHKTVSPSGCPFESPPSVFESPRSLGDHSANTTDKLRSDKASTGAAAYDSTQQRRLAKQVNATISGAVLDVEHDITDHRPGTAYAEVGTKRGMHSQNRFMAVRLSRANKPCLHRPIAARRT